jgi:hypothetical protein|tara:strand:+ start:2949 stop:3068 length:120 start_codon:yes stop_codon:yes gene_type:complete
MTLLAIFSPLALGIRESTMKHLIQKGNTPDMQLVQGFGA